MQSDSLLDPSQSKLLPQVSEPAAQGEFVEQAERQTSDKAAQAELIDFGDKRRLQPRQSFERRHTSSAA